MDLIKGHYEVRAGREYTFPVTIQKYSLDDLDNQSWSISYPDESVTHCFKEITVRDFTSNY